MTTAGRATRTTSDLVIVKTWYQTPRHEAPFYVLVGFPHGDTDAQPEAFITRDADLWNEAVEHESAAGPVVVTWHAEKRQNGQAVKVATAIARQPVAVAS